MRLRPWQYSVGLVVLCTAALSWTYARRSQTFSENDWLFRRLPTDHAVVAGIDVAALRKAGLLDVLAGPRENEDPEYKKFIQGIGFDYRSDLDYVAASIPVGDGPRYFVLNGRFDWDLLIKTATRAGGRCQNTFCDLPGFSQGRNLSFLPVSPTSVGVAVATAPQAARGLAADYQGVQVPSVPVYPAFLSMDAGLLAQGSWVPAILEPAAQVLSSADYVVVGLAAGGATVDVVLDANCMSAERAEQVRQGIERVLATSPAVSALLGSGSLRVEGQMLRGRWPVERRALETLWTP